MSDLVPDSVVKSWSSIRMNKITREQMLIAVQANIKGRESWAEKYSPTGFAKMGNDKCISRAYVLLCLLESGGTPSTQQVVGYFGKGARFVA